MNNALHLCIENKVEHKIIVMQTNVKLPMRAIRVNNGNSMITLKIDKNKLALTFRKLAVALLFIILGVFLVITYNSGNPQFWPLLQAAGILTMIAFIAIKSNNTIKN